MNPVFEAIKKRRAVRRYSAKAVSEELLRELIYLADRAPSGFNLQPWHFVLVRDPNVRKLLSHVAMNQPQVAEAPATIVFVANPRAWKETYPRVLEVALEKGAISERVGEIYRRSVRDLFLLGPGGIFGLAKRLVIPLMRLFRPTPNAVCSSAEATQYVRAQTMLAAATFMIAAKGAGLDTSPMEGFDEYRLKRLLNIPSYMTVPIIIPVGYALDGNLATESVRLPIQEKLSFDLFSNREA